MLLTVKRFVVFVLALAAIGFAAFATLVSHAQRPCIEPNLSVACKKYLQSGGK